MARARLGTETHLYTSYEVGVSLPHKLFTTSMIPLPTENVADWAP